MRSMVTAGCLVLLLPWLAVMAGDGSEKKKDEWKVAEQSGPADTVSLELREGTWMNIDVHPDGREIVFDLLGDIYALPIAGGDARLLAGGLPWEVQPRYSPDGKRISFTSDRAGGDNIWIMNADGSNPQAVSKERFRLLNNAVWMPDGEYLIAKKHFTSTRSLGAGEIWLYHHSGGAGVQLTTRKNDQQDVGEPCVSPDGRWMFFSEDMSGGSSFEYNKDPNTQIYVIRRLDMQKGTLSNYITGQGGAVRPQVSPDGRYLCFVRRVRTRSVLYVQDMQTGEQWPVYGELSKDQQETWATFGVYPGYGWLPGSREVVIWAKGKIRRINVVTRESSEIPFRVQATHSIARALHHKQAAAPERFAARMIRHAQTSPDGQWLVFNAAGYLWKKRLPEGMPERLSNDNGWFEFEPAFSPDGKWVAYTTWSDTAFGAIRKIRLKGGKSQRLSEGKGYYYSPSWSPDGVMLVYRRNSGNSVLGYAYGLDPGIYWIPENGGDGNLICEEGDAPRFNRSSDRIFLQSREGANQALISVNLDGEDRRVLFTSKYGGDILLSPDERWVAFQELFNVYIAAAPAVPAALDIAGSAGSLPVKKVSRDAGISLHWSADSKRLHWTTGPEYYTRDLRESFSFFPGAPDSLPAVDTTGIDIGLTLQQDIPAGKIVLSGMRIITAKGDQVIEDGIIVTDGNRILEIGPRSAVSIPLEAKSIDLTGTTVMPGFVDVHSHLNHWSGMLSTRQNWTYMANLAFGVTTTHDPSASTEMVFSQSEMVSTGAMMGPRIFSTGTILYGAEGNFKAVINSLDDARSHLRRMKAVGAFSVKSYNQPRRDQRQQVIKAARELGMLVYPEGGSFFYHNMSMIADGHTGIEHSIPLAPVYNDVLRFWGASKTGYTPTLVVAYGGLWGENYWYQHTNVWENQRLLTFTPRQVVDSRARRRIMAPEEEYGHLENARTCAALAKQGVAVNIGAHGQLQGLASHWELWMLVQGGMTPLEAIRAATINGAAYIGMQDELGTLEKGKLADLLVLEKNPLESIYHSESLRYVMKNGRLYEAATLNEVAPQPRKRLPFYWENPKSSDGFLWKPGEGFGEIHCGCFDTH